MGNETLTPTTKSSNYIYPTINYTKAISNVPLHKMTTTHFRQQYCSCFKWWHNETQLFMVFHMEHNTLMLFEMERFTNIWLRRPQQDFILSPNIRLHRHPHWPSTCRIFCPMPSLLTCRNCTVCHTKFMLLYAGHCITDNTCNSL